MEVLKLKILDFKYNGKYLSDFGFKVAKTIDNTFGLNREIVVGNINTIRNKPNHYGVKYTNTLPLKYLIMKDPCTNNSQGKLTIKENELREIQRWLTSPKTPKCFTLNRDDNNVREYYGVFTEVEPYEYGDLYGITIGNFTRIHIPNPEFHCGTLDLYSDNCFGFGCSVCAIQDEVLSSA